MKRFEFLKCWNGFLHWKGWQAIAVFWVKAWKRTVSWTGWKKLFSLPLPFLLLMGAACAAGLVWVFFTGREVWVPAYFLYALSAYCLVALCVKIPSVLRNGGNWLSRHPKLSTFLEDKQTHFNIKLYAKQLINFAYGIFKIASGVMIGSGWIGSDGIYNMTQALIQLYQILQRKKAGTFIQQWKSYRFCGVLILFMHLALTGLVFQMVNLNRTAEQGEVMIITTAAFAFFKLISSFLSLAKDRKHIRPVDSSVRMLEFSQAVFAIFSLQAGMLHTFGTGEVWEHWINLAVGCTVCLLTVAMGIYMILRANRELRKIQENEYGE